MSRDFPDWINPWTAADGQRQFAGSVPLKQLGRLVPLLATDDGEAHFQANFRQEQLRPGEIRPWIDLRIEASLRLTCQRSLEPYTETVERETSLAVIETMAEAELLSPDADPVLVEESRLALATLIEDELILALPLVPKNPALEPIGDEAATAEKEETQRPFAQALEGWQSSE